MTKILEKISREELYQKYISEDKTIAKLADEYNCCTTTMSKKLKSLNIRKYDEYNYKDIDQDEILNLFQKDKISINAISKKYKVTR